MTPETTPKTMKEASELLDSLYAAKKKTKNGQCTRNQLDLILRLKPSLENNGPLSVLSFTFEQAQALIQRLLDAKNKQKRL